MSRPSDVRAETRRLETRTASPKGRIVNGRQGQEKQQIGGTLASLGAVSEDMLRGSRDQGEVVVEVQAGGHEMT